MNKRNLSAALAAALALTLAGTASAATLVVEASPGSFIAEAFPDGNGYTYTFSTTPNLAVDAVWGNALTGHCLYNTGSGTVYVTVEYPNGHTESAQRGVRCGFGFGPNY
ncbi:MAG: hypothetical protein KDI56_10520 [Xanthomonadales bacterium]|nr:hypothetical protein [Xanthomonadales bacterium]MCB1628145.1 hypothetical protein [Xanthomonadales bacterium]